jgi:hypothetical protein
MPTLLCAIGHGLYQPWLEILKEGQQKTWLLNPLPYNIEIIHYHGTPVNNLFYKMDQFHERLRWSSRNVYRILKTVDNFTLGSLKGFIPMIEKSTKLISEQPVLHIHFPDLYVTYRWKFLSLMKYFIDCTNHDYLMTTTSASYINLPTLSRKIDEFQPGDLYFGALPYFGAEFVSGSNRILSRQTVQKVLLAKRLWQPGVIEDLALGQLLARIGIKPTFIPIINISSMDELDKFDVELFTNNYHFRLKSGPNSNRKDVEIMRAFHSKFGDAK